MLPPCSCSLISKPIYRIVPYENSIDRSIDFYRACVTSYARNPSPPFFSFSFYKFPLSDLLRIHQALLPRGIDVVEYIGRSIPEYWINPQAPLMASGETRISRSCKVAAVRYVPASSHPLSLFTYVSFFALISC